MHRAGGGGGAKQIKQCWVFFTTRGGAKLGAASAGGAKKKAAGKRGEKKNAALRERSGAQALRALYPKLVNLKLVLLRAQRGPSSAYISFVMTCFRKPSSAAIMLPPSHTA